MPMLHDGPPPLPADMVRDLRTQLAPTYGHKLVSHEGRLVLAVRVPADRPDPHGRDLKACADVLAEEHVANTTHVLLIGDEKVLRVDPIPVRDAIREKLRDDTPASKEVRRQVDREFGAKLLQPAMKRELCLAVRVPRASYTQLTQEDLMRLQQAVGPALGAQAGSVQLCYLVADNDYRRCTPDEFARLLRGESPLRPAKVNNYVTAGDSKSRASMGSGSFSGSPFGTLISNTMQMTDKMQAAKQARKAPVQTEVEPAAPAAPAPAPAPPAAPPAQPPLAQPLAPGLVAFATPPAPVAPVAPAPLAAAPPLFAPPAPAAPVAAPEPATDALATLAASFQGLGYEVMTDVAQLGIHLAAHQPGGKRVIVLRAAAATTEAVQGLTKLVADLGADAGLLVADDVPPGTWLACAGTKVEVLRADAQATL